MEEVCYSSFDHLFFVHSPDSDLGNMDIVVLADEIPDAVQSDLMFLSLLGGPSHDYLCQRRDRATYVRQIRGQRRQ